MELVMPEASKLIAGLLLIAQQPTMPSTEDEDEVDPLWFFSYYWCYSRGRAMGTNYNWGDEDYNMDTADLNAQLMARSCCC